MESKYFVINSRFDAIIFDMDGVLMNNNPFHLDAWVEFASRHGRKVSRNEIESRFGNLNSDYLEWLFDISLSPDQINTLAHEKEEIYRNLLKQNCSPLPGLLPLLNALQSAGKSIALATGGPKENVDFVFELLGIRAFFDVVIHDRLVKKGKPDPEIFLLAASQLNCMPGNCLVFEDSRHGIDAAIAAGMSVIGINTSGKPEKLIGTLFVAQDFTMIRTD